MRCAAAPKQHVLRRKTAQLAHQQRSLSQSHSWQLL
jgi:hypothetical protein